MSTHVLLHNIRSAHNVGSVFRTADAAGVDKIWLTGYTPRPIDRHGRAQKQLAKTALGAEQTLSWEALARPADVIARLSRDGYTLTAVEQDPDAVSLQKYRRPEHVCFVFGNEVSGLSRQVRSRCDNTLEIPMRGAKESLNIAVTAGIVLYASW